MNLGGPSWSILDWPVQPADEMRRMLDVKGLTPDKIVLLSGRRACGSRRLTLKLLGWPRPEL